MKYNFNGFTKKGNAALNNAIAAAERFGHTYIGSALRSACGSMARLAK